jgi:hypothetical protein
MDAEMRAMAARRVEEAYTHRRRAFQPAWHSTSRWDVFWGRVADTLDREGIEDVSSYVEAQFEMNKPSFPQPNMLHSARAVMNYRDWARRRGAGEAETEWELEVRAEISRVNSRRKVFGDAHAKTMALDENEPLSPLMRICILRRFDPACPLPEPWAAGAARLVRVPSAVAAYTEVGLLKPALLEELRGT